MPETATLELERAHELSADRVAALLAVNPDRGLSGDEAARRLAAGGPNELRSAPPVPAWRRFLAQFTGTLVLLLVAATLVSLTLWWIERDTALPFDAIVIFAIVLLNGVLGYVQEARAERAVAALRALAAAEARVVRDGEPRAVPAASVVPGDVLLLEEGDTVPADARLTSVVQLRTLEAGLTGESLPVTKSTSAVGADAVLGDRRDMVFGSTHVAYGRGRAIVTATGMRSEIGRIAGLLDATPVERTPLQVELDRTGRRLGAAVVAIAAVVVLTLVVLEGARSVSEFLDVLVLGVALAVAAVPEGLPAVVTAVLALGVQRMARRNAVIRRLPAVETLGSATVIASDKTGTLTRNEMTVRAVVTASGRVDVSGAGYEPRGAFTPEPARAHRDEILHLLRAAERASNAALRADGERWTIVGDPTEGALVVAARKAGLESSALDERFARVAEVPFSSERKRMSTVHDDVSRGDRRVVFTKGAPDVLLDLCTHELRGADAVPLTAERRREIRRANDALAAGAYRTLGVAFRSVDADEALDERVERDLVFLGLAGMIDPPRPEARDAVRRATSAGIRSVLITGDHPATARAVADELGIGAGGGVVTGATLERLDDSALDETAAASSVFARVNPEHKLRLVQALQRRGAVVAMTGDGVNDAPALRRADIGVAMGVTGTDVSKEAADMVLTDDNFATIVAAVEEGRAIFSNIRKFLRYLLSSNAGEVLTMFLAVVLAVPLGLRGAADGLVLPLLATQVLWINLVTDGLPALALGVDPADPDVMRRPPRPRGAGVVTWRVWRGVIGVGVVMAVGTLAVFDAALPGGFIAGSGDLPFARTMAFTTLVLFQLFNVFNARGDVRSAFDGLFSNALLWAAVLASLAVHALVLIVPFTRDAFDVVPLAPGDWAACALVASTVLWTRELAKLVARARGATEDP